MSECGLQQPARRRLRVADLNPHLMCILCGGYYVDATTIIECLHSFCKSCLVKYLESNKYCPICEVQVHKTRPLQNIRPDETLQNMVYKLVPGLFQREMQIRQEFYSEHPDAPESNPVDRGIIDPIDCQFYTPEEAVCLALEFERDASTPSSSNGVYKRYLRCPAAVTIAHLQKLVRNKFGLSSQYDVEFMFLDKWIRPDLSIMDVAYAFQRKRKEQFHFTYRIVDTKCKKMKLDAPVLVDEVSAPEPMEVDPAPQVATPQVSVSSNSPPESKSKLDSIISRLGKQTQEAIKKEKAPEEWKEVQLQISENGVMSVTDISSLDKLIDTVEKISSVENSASRKPLSASAKVESEEKKTTQNAHQEKTKMSVLALPSAKPPADSTCNSSSGKESVNGPLLSSDVKVSKDNARKENESKVDTSATISVSSISNSTSLVRNIAVSSSSPNSVPMKGLTSRVASPSVPSSSSLPAIKPIGSTSSASTVSVSATHSPISSVSSGSVPIMGTSSTKVIPVSVSATRGPLVSSVAVSLPTSCASTVSVSSVVTPAVSAVPSSPKVYGASTPTVGISTISITPASASASISSGMSSSPKLISVTSPSVSSSSSPVVSVSSSSPAVVASSNCTTSSSTVSSRSSSTSSITTVSRASPIPTAKQPSAPVSSKKSSSSPVGYKTLKCGPKTWNPTISRNSYLSSKMEQQQQSEGSASGSGSVGSSAPGKQATPPRFFKVRNTPRYLGNPASGVKAMYQVPDSQASSAPSQSAPPPLPAAPSKAPSLMKLDPRTLTPIVSNASSTTVKSPTSQSKGRPPFPSTTLSAQVNNHIASSRSVATTTTTTSSANLSSMRSSPSSAQAQVMANFLNPFVNKGMPNFLYGAIPSLLPSGATPFANMPRPYHPVHPAMLFQHQMLRQLSVPPSQSPSPSPPAVQRIPPSSEKSLPSPTYRSNSAKLNGQDSPKSSIAVKPKTSPRPATEPPYSPTPLKTNSSMLSKESSRLCGGSTNDNNNTVPASKVKAHLEKSDGEKLSHNISKLLPKAITKHSENQVSVEPKGAGVSSFQSPHS